MSGGEYQPKPPLSGRLHVEPDQLLAEVRDMLRSFELPGFFFEAGVYGGKVTVRAGTFAPGSHDGQIYWGRRWSINGRLQAYDLAVIAKQCAVHLTERLINARFLLDGETVFAK